MDFSILDIRKPLENLRDGRKLNDIAGLILQILVLIAGVALLKVWLRLWVPSVEGIKFFGWLALILWQLAWPIASYLALQAIFIRAMEIRKLPPARFIVAPMIEQFLRGIGEAVLAASLVLAIPAMIAVWFSGSPIMAHLTQPLAFCSFSCPLTGGKFLEGARFWPGIAVLIGLPLRGLFALLAFYFSAEAIAAVFSIAENIGGIREKNSETPAAQ